jgi:hypothetical protein
MPATGIIEADARGAVAYLYTFTDRRVQPLC